MVDRVLRRLGLMRISRTPFEEASVTWATGEPVVVDLRFRNGKRVAGAVDPYYPNDPPLLICGSNPIFDGE